MSQSWEYQSSEKRPWESTLWNHLFQSPSIPLLPSGYKMASVAACGTKHALFYSRAHTMCVILPIGWYLWRSSNLANYSTSNNKVREATFTIKFTIHSSFQYSITPQNAVTSVWTQITYPQDYQRKTTLSMQTFCNSKQTDNCPRQPSLC